MATDYYLDGPGIESRWGEIFRPSRPALGPTQPPVEWELGPSPEVKYGRGVLLTTHPLLVPRSWKSRAIPLPALWATTGPETGTLYLYVSDIRCIAVNRIALWNKVTLIFAIRFQFLGAVGARRWSLDFEFGVCQVGGTCWPKMSPNRVVGGNADKRKKRRACLAMWAVTSYC